MNSSMPWRPLPSSLLVDPRWLQLTLQERGAFISLVLSADLEGVIDLPGSATAERLLAGLGQISLKAARAMLSKLEEMNLVWTVKDGLQVDVLELNGTPSLEVSELTENAPSGETVNSKTERQRRWRLNKRLRKQSSVDVPPSTETSTTPSTVDANVDANVDKPVDAKTSTTPSTSKDQDLDKDQNTKGNVKESKRGDAVRVREKSPSPSLVEPEQPPPEGTPARTMAL